MSNINYFNTRKYIQINLNIYISNSIYPQVFIQNSIQRKKLLKKNLQSGYKIKMCCETHTDYNLKL